MRKASPTYDNLERPDAKRVRREEERNESFMQACAPRRVDIPPPCDVVSVDNVSCLTSDSGTRRHSAFSPPSVTRSEVWGQPTNASDTIAALLEASRVNARINQARDELLRREVISRLGLHTYLTDQNEMPPPPPPPPAAIDPTMLLLQNLITGSQQQQQQQPVPMSQQTSISPNIVSSLLQAQMQGQQTSRPEINNSSALLDSVISLLQTKISNSIAVQALLNGQDRPAGNQLFDAARLSALQALAASIGASASTGNGTSIPMASGATVVSRTTLAPKLHIPISMVHDADVQTLSEYQCLLREQMDLFEASTEDVKVTAQGRNKPIFLRQVGIQCKHCAHLPPKQRPRGAVYYPARLSSIYQSAQNMGVNHFNGRCPNIPESISIDLDNLKNKKSLLHGGGKKYWAEKALAVGVVEVENGLEFHSS